MTKKVEVTIKYSLLKDTKRWRGKQRVVEIDIQWRKYRYKIWRRGYSRGNGGEIQWYKYS